MKLARNLRRWALFVVLSLAAPLGIASPGQDARVAFRDFASPAFQEAISEDRLIFLVLDVPWSEYSRRADQELWGNPELVAALGGGFVPVRARADLRPDLMRRFPAEGWPAMSILLPDGSPLFLELGEGRAPRRVTSGFRPATELSGWLEAARAYYTERRAEAVELSRRGLERMRTSSVPKAGALSEELVWRVGRQLRNTFDADARYFGSAPRLPRFDLIELMLQLGSEDQPEWALVGLGALETLGRELGDPETGAIYRMALGADWSKPQRELLLDRNARYLDLLALAYRVTGKRAFRERGLAVAAFLDGRLGREDGSFMAGVCAACPGGLDTTVLSGDVALASAALIRAGAAFGEAELVERGLAAARFLAETRLRPGTGLARSLVGETRVLEVHLEDLAESTLAFLAAHEATGQRAWLDRAIAVQALTLKGLEMEGLDALADTAVRPSGPSPLRFALYSMKANSRCARALLKLHRLTGSETYRRKALQILGAFANSYQRLLLHAPAFATALYEAEFDPIEAIVVASDDSPEGTLLRRAALQAEYPHVVVRSVEPGEAATLAGEGWDVADPPLLFARQGAQKSEGPLAADRARAQLARLRLLARAGEAGVDPRNDSRLPVDFLRPRGFRGSESGARDGADEGEEGDRDE